MVCGGAKNRSRIEAVNLCVIIICQEILSCKGKSGRRKKFVHYVKCYVNHVMLTLANAVRRAPGYLHILWRQRRAADKIFPPPLSAQKSSPSSEKIMLSIIFCELLPQVSQRFRPAACRLRRRFPPPALIGSSPVSRAAARLTAISCQRPLSRPAPP